VLPLSRGSATVARSSISRTIALIIECDHAPYTFLPPQRLDDGLRGFMHRLVEVLHPVRQCRCRVLANKVLPTKKSKKSVSAALIIRRSSLAWGKERKKGTHIAITSSAYSHSARLAPPRAGQPPPPPTPRRLPLLRPEPGTVAGRVSDATGKLVRLPTRGRADRDAAAHVERDGANRAHRHHIHQHPVLLLVFTLVTLLATPRRVILGQSKPAPVLPPARGRVKVRRGDEREAAEVFRWCPGEEGVPRAGWGEVERSCELRGVAGSSEESQCEGAARGRDIGVRCGRAGERQRRFEFILRGRGRRERRDCFAYVAFL
jgi:hypothetical protein